MAFETDRLIVRPLALSDFEAWKKGFSLAKSAQNKFDNVRAIETLTYENFESMYKREALQSASDFSYTFYAFSRLKGELLGGAQFWCVLRDTCLRATLGYWVLNTHWRKGIGTELANGMIKYGLGPFGLNRLEVEIQLENLASISMCEKLGMTFEGIRRESLILEGLGVDHLVYSILTSDLIQK